MKIRDFFFPPKRDFVKMLKEQADKTTEGMCVLHEYFQEHSTEKGDRVMRLEEEADDMRRILVEELNVSFITPFDREDIYALSRAVDDMVDYAKTTVEEVLLFKAKPNAHMVRMAEGLHNASKDITSAIACIVSDPEASHNFVVRAKKAENFVEHRYREGLAELFKTDDVIEVLKLREIYRHLSNAADRGDEAANIIGNIIVKFT